MSGQCQAMIKHYWNAMHFVIDSGTIQTKADDKPDTLQVMLVKDLTKDQSRVSDDGQASMHPRIPFPTKQNSNL
jgi:hypothetical protein